MNLRENQVKNTWMEEWLVKSEFLVARGPGKQYKCPMSRIRCEPKAS